MTGTAVARVLWVSARAQVRARASAALVVVAIVQPATFLVVTLLASSGRAHVDPREVALGAGLTSLWGTTVWSAGAILRIERWQGTLPGILSRPAGLATVLAGKSLGATLYATVLIGATVSVVAAAFGHPLTIERPLAFAAALAATLVSAWTLGFLVACVFLLTRAAGRIAEALTYPVFILGGLLVPLSLLPEQVRPLSWVVSLRWGDDVIRAGAAGAPATARPWLLLAATTAVYAAAARIVVGVVLERVRKEGTLDLY